MIEARLLLRLARAQALGEKRGHRARRAARTIWWAACLAADAMIGPVHDAHKVIQAFERAWGAEGRGVATDLECAILRGCFYGNGCACDGAFIERYGKRLGRLFLRPVRDRELRRRLGKER